TNSFMPSRITFEPRLRHRVVSVSGKRFYEARDKAQRSCPSDKLRRPRDRREHHTPANSGLFPRRWEISANLGLPRRLGRIRTFSQTVIALVVACTPPTSDAE